MKKILFVLLLIVIVFAFSKTTICFEIPKGNLYWSDKYPSNAKLCVPASFTGENGSIIGSHRIDNITKGSNVYHKVSLIGNKFYVDKRWHSKNGFTQMALVVDNKAKRFKDNRYFVRRALCKNENKSFIIESIFPMKLSDFAQECAKFSTNAVNLDMGSYGFGYTTICGIKIPMALWSIFWKHKQTNWVYVK